jgi:glycosyltransferase involved in cell wall biosynthesis
MNKKHLLIVANTTWNIYNFRLNVIERLLEEGYQLSVLAPIDRYIHYQEKYPEIDHYGLRNLDRDGMNPLREAQLINELWHKYKKIKPDLILHYTVKPNIYGGIAAKMAGIPSMAVVTGLGYAFIHGGISRVATEWLYRWSSKFHRKVIFENIDDRLLFEKKGLVDPAKAISIKGCGVDTGFFKPMENGLYPGKIIFCFIARLLYDKGIREFVEAANQVKRNHPQVECWVIGERDPENPASVSEEDLLTWVKHKTIIYHGSTNDVRPYIAHSDCVVLPSYREAIARSITEGMAMERPVITTDTAGCKEAVEEGKNGFLVPVKDGPALANAMIRFIELSDQEKTAMGIYGRAKVIGEFDDKIIANQITALIEEQLAGEKK